MGRDLVSDGSGSMPSKPKRRGKSPARTGAGAELISRADELSNELVENPHESTTGFT